MIGQTVVSLWLFCLSKPKQHISLLQALSSYYCYISILISSFQGPHCSRLPWQQLSLFCVYSEVVPTVYVGQWWYSTDWVDPDVHTNSICKSPHSPTMQSSCSDHKNMRAIRADWNSLYMAHFVLTNQTVLLLQSDKSTLQIKQTFTRVEEKHSTIVMWCRNTQDYWKTHNIILF